MLKIEQYQNFEQNLPSRKFSTYVSESYSISKLGILTAMFSSHFFITCLILSHTPMIVAKIYEPEPWEFITSSILFCACWTLFDPWTRKMAEHWESTYSNRNLAIIGIFILSASIFVQIFAVSILIKALLFGLFGGLSASLILSQIDFVFSDTISNDFDKLKKIPVYSQSVAFCIFPSVHDFLKDTYGNHMSNLIIAGLAIQLLPFVLFLRTIGLPNSNSSIKYGLYKNAPQLFHSGISKIITSRHFRQELKTDFNKPKTSLSIHEDEDEEILHYFYKKSRTDDKKSIVSVHNFRPKYSLNTISGKMNDEFNKSYDEYTQDIKTNSLLNESINTQSHQNRRKRKMFCCQFISSYEFVKTKGNFLGFKKFITESVFNPIEITLKLWQFYPALFLKMSYLCMLSNVTNIMVFLLQTSQKSFTKYDILFFLLIQGASWLCLLLFASGCKSILPMKKSYIKFTSSVGCCLEIIGLLVSIFTTSKVCLALGAISMGIANAIISFTCGDTCISLIGPKNWFKIRGCLDIFSAVILFLMGIWLSINIAYNMSLMPYLYFLCFLFLTSSILLNISLIFVNKQKRELKLGPQFSR